MKINCISCGHSLWLDDAYDDFFGMVKCFVCGSLLELKTVEGKIQSVNLTALTHQRQNSAGHQQRRESGTPE